MLIRTSLPTGSVSCPLNYLANLYRLCSLNIEGDLGSLIVVNRWITFLSDQSSLSVSAGCSPGQPPAVLNTHTLRDIPLDVPTQILLPLMLLPRLLRREIPFRDAQPRRHAVLV